MRKVLLLATLLLPTVNCGRTSLIEISSAGAGASIGGSAGAGGAIAGAGGVGGTIAGAGGVGDVGAAAQRDASIPWADSGPPDATLFDATSDASLLDTADEIVKRDAGHDGDASRETSAPDVGTDASARTCGSPDSATEAGSTPVCSVPVLDATCFDSLPLPDATCSDSPADAGVPGAFRKCMPKDASLSDVAFVGQNDTIVTGSSWGGVDVGCGPMAFGTVAFVARFDAHGGCRWSTPIVVVDNLVSSSGAAFSVSIDGDGNAIVTGESSGTVALGGIRRDGVRNVRRGFVARIDPLGRIEWTVDIDPHLGEGLPPDVFAIVDAGGNAFVMGHGGHDTVGIDDCSLTLAPMEHEYLAKLDPSGQVIWTQTFSAYQLGGIATANGRLAIAARSGRDFLLRLLTTDGTQLWERRFTLSDGGALERVAVNPTNTVAITGWVYGDVDFGGGTLSGRRWGEPFFAVFDLDGRHRASRVFPQTLLADAGGGPQAYGADLDLDPNGNVLAVGNFSDSIDFGVGLLTRPASSSPHGFALLLDPNLNALRSRAFDSMASGAALGCDGALYVGAREFLARGP
jgi:hypothetical protein